jgi:TRAP-type C4-dicarboxylate transport system substrate-binding protein
MKRIFRRTSFHLTLAAIVCAGLLLAQNATAAGTTRIRIATIAPKGTTYDKVLRRLASEWTKMAKGQAKVTVFSGGSQGGESAIVDSMRIDHLQAGLLTAVGLSKMTPEVQGMQAIPMMFRSLDEVQHVNEELRPKIERMLADKGFVVLFWADTGWVHFFTTEPAKTPDDIRKLKIFSWAGDTKTERVYRKSGFQPVPMETAEILAGLKTGRIDAVPMPPFAAMAGQINTSADHMLQLKWAPLVGAFVVNKKTWDALPADLRSRYAVSARGAGKVIQKFGRKESENSVIAMQKRGLKVQVVDAALEKQWREAAREAWPIIRGDLVPADIFDEVQKVLADFRAGKK